MIAISRKSTSVALSVVLSLALGALMSSAQAGDKPIDWDKKLEKERHLVATNNVEEGMKILQDFLKKHPESGALHTDMGICLKKRGKLGEAKSEFKRATEVEPNYADAWYELGACQQGDDEFELAVNSFEHYLQIAPYSDKKKAVEDRINFCKSKL